MSGCSKSNLWKRGGKERGDAFEVDNGRVHRQRGREVGKGLSNKLPISVPRYFGGAYGQATNDWMVWSVKGDACRGSAGD